MELNKTNLNVVNITVIDKAMPLLNNVHIAEDGSTVGANAQAIITVAPISNRVKRGEPLTIASDTIKEVLKAIPSDKRFKELLDMVEVERVGNKVQFAFNDGKRERTIDAKTYSHDYINYKELYKRELNKKPLHRVILNKKRLFTVLQTLEKLVPEKSGEFPIFAEFTDTALILRLIHPSTGQRVVAIMVLSTGEWLPADEWEETLKGEALSPAVQAAPLQRIRPKAVGTLLRRKPV